MTGPGPVPETPPVTVTHVEFETAVQKQLLPVWTWKVCPEAPDAAMEELAGFSS
jgi:hypothetical protein